MMKTLYLIQARGGSKGIPKKNIRLLAGKPLISYTIEAAQQVANNEDICVSTDSVEIKKVAEEWGLKVPFLRPAELSSDHSTNEDVLLHALEHYRNNGREYEYIVLLQPTSPLRTGSHIKEAMQRVTDKFDMVVSVKETNSNPYYVLFEENEEGELAPSKNGHFTRRQDLPVVYELNGAIYIIRIKSLLQKTYKSLSKTKYVMPKSASIDIDDEIDLKIAELMLKKDSSVI